MKHEDTRSDRLQSDGLRAPTQAHLSQTPFSLRPLAYATSLLALLGGSAISGQVSAAGFQLSEHGARGLGRANAGEAAIGDTAAVLARNTAAMTRLEGINVSGVLSFIDLEVEANGTTTTASGITLPANDDNAGPNAFVPGFYSSYQLDEKLFVGFAVFSNFGLKTDYDSRFGGLDVADEASVETVNITPSIAYKLTDQVSLGFGIDYVLADAQLNTSVPAFVPGVPGTPKILDLEGDGDAFGYHLSALFELTQATRIGMQYRSSLDIDIEGDAESEFPAPFSSDGSLELNLPDIAEIAAYHEINSDWAVHGSVNYTNWERFDSLIADIDAVPTGPVTLKEENWDANLRYAIGVTHNLNERIILRGGFALDKSPVPRENRTLSIPDSDRMWFSAGASYLASDNLSLDFGISRLEGDSVEVTEVSALGNTVVAEVEGSATIASVQVNAAF
ncbi:OmpP1/FadL family transporter [Allohahella marinimesophila]|uniref:Outer membrane protein transport protein n=1 Tax=Allohahella marinimesophila TaxID=1054972 RepID=A0ABP7PEG6_9GAMM